MNFPSPPPPTLDLSWQASPGLAGWLAEQHLGLVISGYQSARLFLVGTQEEQLTVEPRAFVPCMGLARQGDALYVGTRHSVWRLRQEEAGQLRADRCWLTGDVKVHDVGIEDDGTPLFVNTLYNCIVRPARRGIGFEPVYRPDFISELVAEDRCHLNGMAMEGGRPRYATCLAASNVAGGWRERKHDGGLLLDLATGKARLEGLCMPHSPRIHRGQVWMHNSGQGWLGRADLEAGRFEPVAFVPGILRGLAFHGEHAVAATSQTRYFGRQELPIEVELARRGTTGECGVCVINVATGQLEHRLVFQGLQELYDVQVLPGAAHPRLVTG